MAVLKKIRPIIFGVDNYNSLGILRSLGHERIKSILIVMDSRCNVAYKSKYVHKYHRVSSLEEGYNILLTYLQNFTDEYDNFIITNDDKAQAYLDEHYDELSKLPVNYFNCARTDIKEYMNKKTILEIAEKAGFHTLKSIVVNKSENINDQLSQIDFFPIITKAISPLEGKWKGDVYICENIEELKTVINKIESNQILIQKYIDKLGEYCIDGFSINYGTNSEFTFATTYNYNIKGYYSPYMTVHELGFDFKFKLEQLLKILQYEGIFSIEFLIDKDAKIYFSEVNFRNSTWSYIGTKLNRNIPYRWILSTMRNKIIQTHAYIDRQIPYNFTAMVEPIDYQKRVIDRGYSRIKWFKDLLTTNCKFYFNIYDLKPWLHMLINNKKLR